MTDSFATGSTNLAIPQAAYTGTRIFEQDVPKGTKLYKFFDFDNQYDAKNHPPYPGQIQSGTTTGKASDDVMLQEIKEITSDNKKKGNIFYASDDEPSDDESASRDRGAHSSLESNQAKLLSSFTYRESHYFLK